MIVLDSNIFIGLFFPLDSLHGKSKGYIDLLQEKDLYYTSEVLKEVVTIVAIRQSSQKAIEIKKVIEQNFINFPYPLSEEEVWSEFEILSPHRFSYTDVSLYCAAKKYGLEVITFDEKLQKRIDGVLGKK